MSGPMALDEFGDSGFQGLMSYMALVKRLL